MRNFGKNLARLRKARGLSQRELATALETSQSHINNLETGDGDPSWRFARIAAEFFQVTLDDMATEVELERVAGFEPATFNLGS